MFQEKAVLCAFHLAVFAPPRLRAEKLAAIKRRALNPDRTENSVITWRRVASHKRVPKTCQKMKIMNDINGSAQLPKLYCCEAQLVKPVGNRGS